MTTQRRYLLVVRSRTPALLVATHLPKATVESNEASALPGVHHIQVHADAAANLLRDIYLWYTRSKRDGPDGLIHFTELYYARKTPCQQT